MLLHRPVPLTPAAEQAQDDQPSALIGDVGQAAMERHARRGACRIVKGDLVRGGRVGHVDNAQAAVASGDIGIVAGQRVRWPALSLFSE